jgi:hypothetical protein
LQAKALRERDEGSREGRSFVPKPVGIAESTRPEAAEQIREAVEPSEDIWDTVEYKRRMAAVFARRALLAAAARAAGARPGHIVGK